MSNTRRMQKCPHCGGGIARTTKEQTCIVDETRFVARVPAFSCRKCRALFLPGRILERVELEVASAIALRAAPTGERLRFLRKALGMRAMTLASLLQVTAETLSRWEHDQRRIDVNAWITVGSLVLEKARRPPATLERLTDIESRPKLPKTVEVTIASELPKLGMKLTRGAGTAAKAGTTRGTAAVGR